MHYARAAALALLLLPSIAFGAGFAKQSLFLSKSPVTEGEQVFVHAVVQNDAAAPFDGDLVFSTKTGDTKDKIGSVAVSIAAGGAQAASVSWKPAAGDQTVVAALTQKDGTVVEEESATFSIAKKPMPVVVSTTTLADAGPVESSADVQAMIAKFSPAFAGVLGPAFQGIDSFRGTANGFLNQGLAWSKNTIGSKKPSEVLGAATSDLSPTGIIGTLSYFGATVATYVILILKWILTHTGVFYPVVAIGFLFAIWKLMAGMRRPRY